jgi:hypothetical protein
MIEQHLALPFETLILGVPVMRCVKHPRLHQR